MSYAILSTMVGRPIDTTVEHESDPAFLAGLAELRGRLADVDAEDAAMEEDEAYLSERLEEVGFHALHEGSRFFGVLVEDSEFDVCFDAVPVESLKPKLVPTDEEISRARAVCDALPDSLKTHPALMPFGTYLVVGYS